MATGLLRITHLRRFWDSRMSAFEGKTIPRVDGEAQLDAVLLSGLGLAIEETARVLAERPSFDDFVKWILALDGGELDEQRLERLEHALTGAPYGPAVRRMLQEVDATHDVLGPDDLAHWDEHGYVILRGAVSVAEARAAESAVFEHLGMASDRPASWYERPIGQGIMTTLYRHPALAVTRSSARIRKAFAQIWGTSDLWVSTDRAGFNPPETALRPFPGPHLHWDISLTPPIEMDTGGILYLCDVAENQGAFTCVPGFHRTIEGWLKGLPPNVDPRRAVLDHAPKPIAASAGDMVIWHGALPHASSPNRASYPRVVQYINLFPLDRRPEKPWR